MRTIVEMDGAPPCVAPISRRGSFLSLPFLFRCYWLPSSSRIAVPCSCSCSPWSCVSFLLSPAFRQAEAAVEPASRPSYGWAVLHFFEKDYEQAEEKLRAALEADPALNDARYQLSRTCWCMGRKDEAKALLEQYLDLGGGDYTSTARKALRDNY